MKTISELFSREVLKIMKCEIEQSSGNEVLFLGWLDDRGVITRVEAVARGNKECVSFPYERGMGCHVVIHNHPDEYLIPSEADMNIATRLSQWGIGFYIVNNSLSDVYIPVEPFQERVFMPVEVEQLVKLASEGGRLNKLLDGFEERPGQKEMLRKVCEALNTRSPAMIEAGTGIGKSIGYLIPTISWAIKNNKRVVVSTATINLQEQLIRKDIPLVKKLLEIDFDYVLMKGRQNYVCLRKVEELKHELFTFFSEDEIEQFNIISEWVYRTDDGSLSDLGFIPKHSVWDAVCSETITCMGNKCNYFNRCFFNRIRYRASKSTIIVTNHHYLIADSSLPPGTELLPPYSCLILDEAHKIEDSATSYYTDQIDRFYLIRVLKRLYFRKKGEGGFIVYLQKKMKNNVNPQAEEGLSLDEMKVRIISIYDDVNRVFDGIDDYVGKLFGIEKNAASSETFGSFRYQYELNEEHQHMDSWNETVFKPLFDIKISFDRLIKVFERLKKKVLDDEFLQKQIEGYCTRFSELSSVLSRFVALDDRSYVRWIEYRRGAVFYTSRVDVSEVLKETLFKTDKTYVLTSATLTVANRFNFIKKRLGIENDVMECVLPSPFDYKNQMKILIPTDAPNPDNPDYVNRHAEMIYELLMLTGGGAFVLFTSYNTMNGVVSLIRAKIEESGIRVLVQGDRPRYNLLEAFKDDLHSVLMGTESFWEGVDAPGYTLRSVIISKLPFKVPSDPVVRARMEKISSEFGNPFMEYLLPLAVIKIKQGIGRLIRSKNDRGIITVLDSRIISRNYSSVFINSLPPAELIIDSFKNIIKKFNFL